MRGCCGRCGGDHERGIGMEWILRGVGTALVLITLADVYLTVLYPGSSGPLSGMAEKGGWRLLRRLALSLHTDRDRLLSFAADQPEPGILQNSERIGAWNS